MASTEKGLKLSADYLKCIRENRSQIGSNSTKLKQVVNLWSCQVVLANIGEDNFLKFTPIMSNSDRQKSDQSHD
jgi:hypothetical protein